MESTYKQKADSKQELAEERTEAAHVRSLLAKERTFSAWLRTGLAMLATGFAIAQLLTDVSPQWLVPALSALFVVVGAAIFVIGYWSYRKTLRRLEEEGARGIPAWVMALVTAILMLGAVAGLFLIF